MIVGSDFSRTPYYNSGEGKDHWPYGSYIIMEKGAKYTNRMIAGTDEVQDVVKIDLRTRDDGDQRARECSGDRRRHEEFHQGETRRLPRTRPGPHRVRADRRTRLLCADRSVTRCPSPVEAGQRISTA